jgi:NTE family protein
VTNIPAGPHAIQPDREDGFRLSQPEMETGFPLSSRPRVGIVLGAGGIRGCAHAGVIAALRDANIPIDLVVGASVGSMFGLGLAAGLATEEIAGPAREARPVDVFRFYAGRLRTRGSNPIARMLTKAGGGKEFADLPTPFAVMATDMETGTPTVLDCGPVLPAVEASISLPFIARPVAIGGRYYVDGGLMETAPVYVAHAMGAQVVIAVCLGLNYTVPTFFRRRPWTRSIVERLGRQARPVRGRFHDQVQFGCRLYASCYERPLPANDADVAVWPQLGTLSPNSMFGASFCFEQGLKAGREAVPRIRETIAAWNAGAVAGAAVAT